MKHTTPAELARWQENGHDFELLDVRRAGVRSNHGAEIAGGRWLDPAAWLEWKDSIGTTEPVVMYCAKGHEISQALATALTVLGADACYLKGGMQGWLEEGRPVQPLDRKKAPF